MYFIEIVNSFDGSALSRGDSGLPISTKKDKEVHGIGLKNIRKCAVKYGGDLDCIVEGNKFTLSVMVKS
jgi:signal transduction histidine kinase